MSAYPGKQFGSSPGLTYFTVSQVNFTATQEFRTRYKHAGFVWDAVMQAKSCIPNLSIPINVCDAYIDGRGIMKAALPMGIPVLNQKDSLELNQGELLRWAAEATLFPLALLPPIDPATEEFEETALKWLPSDDEDANSATLVLKNHGVPARLKFNFDPETHLVTSMEAMRHRAVGDSMELTQWKGFCSKYELHGGLRVPTIMEVGWQLEEGAQPLIYFKGRNSHYVFLMNSHPTHPCSRLHAHSE